MNQTNKPQHSSLTTPGTGDPAAPARGRGAGVNPANRFETLSLTVLDEHRNHLAQYEHEDARGRKLRTEVFRDTSRSALNRVDSPDINFTWTLNPYRGCEHGCIYCYARPGHEYLSLSSGLDFETKLFAKPDLPNLLRHELAKPKWNAEPIVLSGVTDCYQPVESRLRLTRQCLEVLAEARQPISIVTKNRLVLRDLDLLTELARHQAVHAAVSVTTLDPRLAGKLEPRASSPNDRLETIRQLSAAGIPVTAMVAPLIPALNDREMPRLLEAAADAGASSAAYVLLRLPHAVKDLFEDWLQRHFPDRCEHVLNLVRQARGGKLYDAAWGTRMRGQGPYAEQIANTFKVFRARNRLNAGSPGLSNAAFQPPRTDEQLPLFDTP